ncbi:MAG: tRNA 2-thiouridine(34) synthase MnmA [Clostridiales bacterium]|nr:tRNA 2-thiouridine(34) synthase MnmA [Clostridiales bacterium]
METETKKEKIVVGLSGGVDSSAAALILKGAGHDVVGVTLLLCDSGVAEAQKAGRAAAQIGIEHRVYDLRRLFSQKVMDYFSEEYISGATPNPCIICNSEFKFGEMLKIAHEQGAQKIATGHYAKTEKADGRYLLKRASSAKDQSYFLCRLSQTKLSAAVFPLAEKSKDEIRRLVSQAGLDTASKGDSQEVCFIPGRDYASFICRYKSIVPIPGDFIDADSNIIGRHKGTLHYTVGQRKGLGAFGRPMYVAAIDAAANTVTLCEEGGQYSSGLVAGEMNWIAFEEPKDEFRAEVQIRHKAKPAPASVRVFESKVFISLDSPQKSVAPGQTAVLYDGDYVLGGGRIISSAGQS